MFSIFISPTVSSAYRISYQPRGQNVWHTRNKSSGCRANTGLYPEEESLQDAENVEAISE